MALQQLSASFSHDYWQQASNRIESRYFILKDKMKKVKRKKRLQIRVLYGLLIIRPILVSL